MSNVLLEDTQRAGDHKESNQSRQTVSIKVRTVRTRTSVSAAAKGVESNARQSKSLTRVSTWGFTGSHVVSIGDLKSADFTGMDSSGVISAWGLSRPGVDLLATYLDIHRVSSANVFDLIPADSDLAERIGNSDSLIEEGHLGANESQMKNVGNHQGPCDRNRNSAGAFTKKALANNSGAENVDSTSKEVTTSRTVSLRITHTSSLSRKVLR